VKVLINRLKFEGLAAAAEPLGRRLGEDLRTAEWLGDFDLIVPVPDHWRRRYARGYNPAQLIAAATGRAVGKPVREVLVRTAQGPSQVGLGREARLGNPVGRFRVRRPRAAAGRCICLVDDVLTTGATVSECARLLRAAGAAEVVAAAAARQS
jgi:ComF family protein